jgi:hypothetical protein
VAARVAQESGEPVILDRYVVKAGDAPAEDAAHPRGVQVRAQQVGHGLRHAP